MKVRKSNSEYEVFNAVQFKEASDHLKIVLRNRKMKADDNDWIIYQDHPSTVSVCNADVFEQRYIPDGQQAPVDPTGRLMIKAEVIDQDKQRYPTVGDWQFDNLGALIMKISDMKNPDYEFLVMMHEAGEAWLCRRDGITQEEVDDWDMGEGKDLDDPGSDPKAPYHKQHMVMTEIEKILCDVMGLDWEHYQKIQAETCPT